MRGPKEPTSPARPYTIDLTLEEGVTLLAAVVEDADDPVRTPSEREVLLGLRERLLSALDLAPARGVA